MKKEHSITWKTLLNKKVVTLASAVVLSATLATSAFADDQRFSDVPSSY